MLRSRVEWALVWFSLAAPSFFGCAAPVESTRGLETESTSGGAATAGTMGVSAGGATTLGGTSSSGGATTAGAAGSAGAVGGTAGDGGAPSAGAGGSEPSAGNGGASGSGGSISGGSSGASGASGSGGASGQSPVATLFEDCSYGGDWEATLAVGEYDTAALMALGAGNNGASSLHVSPGYEVTLYDGDGFSGESLTLQSDTSCLTSLGLNDLTSSVRVAPSAP